jgi:hypothetical protein
MSTGLFLDSALTGRSKIYKVVKIASYHKGSRKIFKYALKKNSSFIACSTKSDLLLTCVN